MGGRDLIRRTSDVARLPKVRVSPFWEQAQPVLGPYLQKSEYDEKLYVPVVNSSRKEVSVELEEVFEMQGEPKVLLVHGRHGVGKTSAIKRLMERLASDEKGDRSVVVYVDGNPLMTEHSGSPGLQARVVAGVQQAVATFLKKSGISQENFLLELFENDDLFVQPRLFLLNPSLDKISAEIEKQLAQPFQLAQASLRFLTRKLGDYSVLVILDNLDPLGLEKQLAAVGLAQALAASGTIKCIVAVRSLTASEIRYHHPQAIGPIVKTDVPSPRMINAIRRRVEQALGHHGAKDWVVGQGAMRRRVTDAPEFAEILEKGLSSHSVEALIEGLADQSVRDALHIALRVYQSPYIDTGKILKRITKTETADRALWSGYLPYYIVIKALLLADRQAFMPEDSWVKNIFGTFHSGTHLGPFLRMHVLSALDRRSGTDVPLKGFVAEMVSALDCDESSVEVEVKWLRGHSWVEALNKDNIRITGRGLFILRVLAVDIDYLTYVSTDVDMDAHLAAQLVVPANHSGERLANLRIILKYLFDSEDECFRVLSRNNLGRYKRVFGVSGPVAPILSEVLRRLEGIQIPGYTSGQFVVAEVEKTIAFVADLVGRSKVAKRFEKYSYS